jgi:hypothetical protein
VAARLPLVVAVLYVTASNPVVVLDACLFTRKPVA